MLILSNTIQVEYILTFKTVRFVYVAARRNYWRIFLNVSSGKLQITLVGIHLLLPTQNDKKQMKVDISFFK